MQEDEPSAFVAYDRFEQKMLELLESGEYAPDNEDTLLAAFRVGVGRIGWIAVLSVDTPPPCCATLVAVDDCPCRCRCG